MDSRQWYEKLEKPSWSPDASVFGQVWSKLYVIILVVNVWVVVLLMQQKIDWKVALPFWLNLFFNIIFSPIQFGLRNNLLATLDILLILGTLIWAMWAIWPYAYGLSLAFIPYFVWVCIATVLQVSITIKN